MKAKKTNKTRNTHLVESTVPEQSATNVNWGFNSTLISLFPLNTDGINKHNTRQINLQHQRWRTACECM